MSISNEQLHQALGRTQQQLVDMQNRLIKAESDLDIAEENYKTLEALALGFSDRIKYNHNDVLDLMERIEKLDKKVNKLQPKKSWKFWKRK